MPILENDTTGFCHGVRRAVNLAEGVGQNQASAVIYGHLVHNPQQVAALEEQGLRHVADWRGEEPGTLIVRTHGIAPGEKAEIEAAGWQVVNATCPLVTRTHNRADTLHEAGYPLAVVGKADHPEVKALCGGDYGQVLVFETLEDVDVLVPRLRARLGVVIQSTFSPAIARSVIGELALRVMDLRVFNTVCDVTQKRIEAALGVAAQVDVMIVVGGHHSANTRQVTESCRRIVTTHQVETEVELQREWFAPGQRVGLASGLSTPAFEIDRVRAALTGMVGA
jgi:4-hydroxy-3-methylbut-2-enyl diphosphate reductase